MATQEELDALYSPVVSAQANVDATRAAYYANPDGGSTDKYGRSQTYSAYLAANRSYEQAQQDYATNRANLLGLTQTSSSSGGTTTDGPPQQTQIQLLPSNMPGANQYNTMAVAMNAARSNPQSAQSSVTSFVDSGYKTPSQIQNPYAVMTERALPNRPDYTPPAQLGDTQTDRYTSAINQGFAAVNIATGQNFGMSQENTRTAVIGFQMANAQASNDYRSTQYYGGELQKGVENKVARASEYHYIGKLAGVPIDANPFEYQGDLAVEFLKGAPQSDKERFSPVSGQMSASLPGGGYGLQQYQWDLARGNEKGTLTPSAYNVNFAPATAALINATGNYGPYGSLYGGPDYRGTPSSEGLRMQTPTVFDNTVFNRISAGLASTSGNISSANVQTPTSRILADRVGIAPTSPMGVEMGMAEGSIPKPFRSGGNASTDTLPNFYDVVATKKSEYSTMLAAYEAGGSKDVGQYNELTKRSKELNALSMAEYGLEIGRSSLPEVTTVTTKQSGALPFFGVVPGISGVISYFEPVETKTTTKTGFGSTTTTSYGATPINAAFQQYTPSNEQAAPILRVASLANPFYSAPFTMAGYASEKLTDFINPSNSENMRSQNKILESYTGFGGKYEALREDPTMFAVSYGVGTALGASGGALRSFGVGTKYVSQTSKAGEIYQTGSKLITGTVGFIYASDVSERVTGTSLVGYQRTLLPAWTEEKNGFAKIQSNFKGVAPASKELNKIVITEVVPFIAGVGIGSRVGDFVADRVRTKGMTEIKNPEEFSYMSEEGFPTNKDITTQDLRDSFNQGTMKVKGNILESKMAPDMTPLERVPSHPQRDAKLFGETHIYSGAETPHLDTNIVSAGHSEIPGMYNAPTGQAYFTKAGMVQGGGGIGMSSDLFGIYRNPIMYRISTKTGDLIEIPESILKTPTQGMSTNDPLNPRNIAITNWIENNAAFGKPIIGQYGKSEWQSIIREGSTLKREPLGYFVDKPTGRRVVMEGVKFTGKGVTPTKPINPNTGKPYGRELARFYIEMGGGMSSGKGSSKTMAPIIPSVSIKSSSSVESSMKSLSSQKPSSKIPSSSITPSEISRTSKSPSDSMRSSITTPSSKLYPSSSPDISSRRTATITTPTTSKLTSPTYTKPPSYSKTPTITKPPYSPPPEPLGGGWLPPGGGSGSPQRGFGIRSAVATHPVGADLLGVSRGSFTPMTMPRTRKTKKMGMPAFRMPKF